LQPSSITTSDTNAPLAQVNSSFALFASIRNLCRVPAKLSTHVLDTANGRPARGMQIELWLIYGERRNLLKTVFSNSDGRTDQPLLSAQELTVGEYELIFYVGDYFAGLSPQKLAVPFLGKVPVRFGISEEIASYHVPLLVSPWAYSTYRGS